MRRCLASQIRVVLFLLPLFSQPAGGTRAAAGWPRHPPPQPSLLRARVREMSRLVTARYTPDAKRTAAAAAAALGPNGQWMPVIGQFRVGGRKLQSPSFFTGYTRCTRTDLLTADLHGGEIVGCCRCNWLDRPTALTLVKDLTNQRWTTQRVMSTARPRRRLEFKCIQ